MRIPSLSDITHGRLDDLKLSFRNLLNQEQETSVYLRVGSVLVKVHMAAFRVGHQETTTLSCMVTEIEGTPVSAVDQEEKMEILEIDSKPTSKDQRQIIVNLFQKFGLIGDPVPVTETYARGHLRSVRLQGKIAQREIQ